MIPAVCSACADTCHPIYKKVFRMWWHLALQASGFSFLRAVWVVSLGERNSAGA